MYAIIDTETTGLPIKSLPITHQAQPHIISLGCLLLDENFTIKRALHELVQPDGWMVPAEAEQWNGLTQAQCMKYGRRLCEIMDRVDDILGHAHFTLIYNAEFDEAMLDREGYLSVLKLTLSRCAMKAATVACKIPGRRGDGYKWPKLTEAYSSIVGMQLVDAHNALADCMATAQIAKVLSRSSRWNIVENTYGN